MREAVAEQGRRWDEYRQLCYQDIVTIINGFGAYCQMSAQDFALAPVHEEYNPQIKYFVPSAAKYQNDGFWHFGLVFNFSAFQMALLELGLTRSKGKVLVKIGRDGEARELDLSIVGNCDSFYEQIVEFVKASYTNRLEQALDSTVPVKLGFIS
jgi:hypothetical protein